MSEIFCVGNKIYNVILNLFTHHQLLLVHPPYWLSLVNSFLWIEINIYYDNWEYFTSLHCFRFSSVPYHFNNFTYRRSAQRCNRVIFFSSYNLTGVDWADCFTWNISVVYGATIFCGGTLVSRLVGSAPHRAAGFLRHFSWSRPLTLTVPLSIVY